MARWKSDDKIISQRTLFPKKIIDAVAKECTCVVDFFAGADGLTLIIGKRGGWPHEVVRDSNGKENFVDADAKRLTVSEAIDEYGADAAWLALEYGKSYRGEREDKYRNIIERRRIE